MGMIMFVQFPHPGAEHRPKSSVMDWNRGDHARKFLLGVGTYVTAGTAHRGPMVFWGEWEPQSRVVDTYLPDVPGGPRWLHDPFLNVPRHRSLLRNTDPLVFGDHFLYSNCRQHSNGKLRQLAPGSLILFGSKVRSEFVLDTVFVVGNEPEAFTRGEAKKIECDSWIRSVVFDPLHESSGRGDELFRLYRSRQFDEAPDGPFSFVPCLPHEAAAQGFVRPVITLGSRWINPSLAMGAKATKGSMAEVADLWGEVVRQVSDAGLSLGVQLEVPPESAAKEYSDGDWKSDARAKVGSLGSSRWGSATRARAVRIPDGEGAAVPKSRTLPGGRSMVVQPSPQDRSAAVTSPPTVSVREPALLITINQLYRDNMSAERLYEATRGVWVLGPRRENVEYAFAVYQGIVKEVYRVDRWLPAGTSTYNTRRDPLRYRGSGRWEFEGVVARDIRDRYVGYSVGKGGQNPIRYVNA